MHLIENEDEIYDKLQAQCLKMFEADEKLTVIDMAITLMDNEEVPMHYPFHHFIVPAVLLTATKKAQQAARDELCISLTEALKRSKYVLGGFCGSHGACGAAIGMGIYMSIATDNTPMSTRTWSWVNQATGVCLQEISKIPGPRCCKRTVFIVLKTAITFVKEKLNIDLPMQEQIICKYYERNAECKRVLCSFYQADSEGEKE
ncbi:hypothetical protein SOV_44340 [Sporomusa ovata DSM 2662]|uniref:Methyltransferase n=1 Tax=Sporomusa ovata TaxID=2378 RepID=A0A0U1KU10_9FIRM|nr:DUF5714 domain-containing protein [Sporomusa ovata]EQB26822.1 hypothetical protein SOV_3c06960 [Sporomusa ovata DSM 2662]CQR70922.1 Methyltransferase [Sporomusa ovata]